MGTILGNGRVRPDPRAMELGREMLGMEDVMREILDETIPGAGDTSVHESGRTICGPGTEVKGPLARFPTSVKLDSCPRGVRGGTWHTHVTKEQLRSPNNSLPDAANVVFGEIDVSIVVGTHDAEMLVAADDREHAAEVYRDAIGADVHSTDDVIDALVGGQVPNPRDARERVRARLSPLFSRRMTRFHDLDKRLSSTGIPAHAPGVGIDMLDAMRSRDHRDHVERAVRVSKNPLRDPQGVRNWAREKGRAARGGQNVADTARTTAISAVVGQVVRSLFFS